MANFQKDNRNVHGTLLQVPFGKPFELGLWGPIDIRNMTELDVSARTPNPAVTITRGKMLPGQPVRVLIISGLPAGQTVLEAKDLGGFVWTSVTLDTTPAAAAPATKYTNNANEVLTQQTPLTPAPVVTLLLANWSALTANGARTLTAQVMTETGGTHCYNWNVGNVKSGANDPHMYLRNVWEVDTPEKAATQVAGAGGLARIATDDEITKHGWARKEGKTIVVYNPPHAQCRFRAYTSLQDGAQRWLGKHQTIAGQNADYVANLNAGSITAVARALTQARYFTQDEAIYAAGMTRWKRDIDKALGPIP